MANDQFQVPNSEHHHDPALADRFFDVVGNVEPLTIPQEIQVILEEIESFRASATEANIPRPLVRRLRELLEELVKRPVPLYERLVDLESNHGGKIFKSDNPEVTRRFWTYQGYWYFEEQHPVHGEYVLSYDVKDTIVKMVNAKIVPLTEGEPERLLEATRKYRDLVRDNIYLVDAALAELLAEESQPENKSDYDLAA